MFPSRSRAHPRGRRRISAFRGFLWWRRVFEIECANTAGAGAFFSSDKALSRGSLAKTPPCCFIRSVRCTIFRRSLRNNHKLTANRVPYTLRGEVLNDKRPGPILSRCCRWIPLELRLLRERKWIQREYFQWLASKSSLGSMRERIHEGGGAEMREGNGQAHRGDHRGGIRGDQIRLAEAGLKGLII